MEKTNVVVELGDGRYLRMNRSERIQHFILLSTFITLVITGFWLKYPEAFWVKWITFLIGKSAFELRGVIHRTASVLMVAGCIYHLYYIAFTFRGRHFLKDVLPAKRDLTDVIHVVKYYFSNTVEKPRFGRFSYVEKAEYWAVVWGTVIMGATGMVLWFQNKFLPVIHTSGMNLATAIHFYEAILATLAIIVWHFYFVFFNPDVVPMNKAWLYGYLDHEEMEKEHPLELEKLAEHKKLLEEQKIDEVNEIVISEEEENKLKEEELKDKASPTL
ncbi:MAG: cytochrome b/b6 domain-containing protein [Bacteroidetes bacterium]|nr:cytochrome b/b6 domain-containing protein [Bacteroidota bacterium]